MPGSCTDVTPRCEGYFRYPGIVAAVQRLIIGSKSISNDTCTLGLTRKNSHIFSANVCYLWAKLESCRPSYDLFDS